MRANNYIQQTFGLSNRLAALMLALFTLTLSALGQAACITPALRVPVPASLTMPANVRNGDILANWTILNTTVNCTGLAAGETYTLSTFWNTKWTRATVTIPFPDGSKQALIYSGGRSTAIAGYAAVLQGLDGVWRETLGDGASHGSLVAATNGTLVLNFNIAMAIVKMGTALTGEFDAAYLDIGYKITRNSTGDELGRGAFRATGTVFSTKTCTVSTTSVNVTLPEIAGRDVPSINSTAGSTPFSIKLNCPQTINIYMTLTDASNVGNQTGVLGGMPSSAVRGVALQIMSGSNVVKFGPDSFSANNTNQFLVGSKVAGSITIPFTVSYIRTATTVTPGVLKSAATFTMSYQ